MPGLNQPLLINILGHAAGALIFAIFLVLLYSGRGWSGLQGRYLSALAASLSLAWNLGSLVVLAWPELPAPTLDIVVALSFSMLSLLPAVLLQVSLEGAWPALVGAGYALSGAAVIMHFWEIQGNGPALHQTALLVITTGFLILAVVAVAAPALRKRRGGIRILASVCLALFAMSLYTSEMGTPVRRGPASWSCTTRVFRWPCSFYCRTTGLSCWMRSYVSSPMRCWPRF